jgi:glutamate formiminotransferase/glutamate formiminotransferase/formiminotetrahydrofolate cyclodeaminase
VRTRADDPEILECVVNVSEGRDDAVLVDLAAAAGPLLLDLHRDPDHNRSVFTLAGPPDAVAAAARDLATATLDRLDLRTHEGAHPRLGVLDVVPFVPYAPGAPPPADLAAAGDRRDGFARWLAETHGVPAFLYGPLPGGATRTLPDVRRHAFGEGSSGLRPDFGPSRISLRSGATAVGARPVLVAYNIWVDSPAVARVVAPQVRSAQVRALGLTTGVRAQVSCNLIDPVRVGPAAIYDAVAALVEDAGGTVEGAELVGLIPELVLAAVPPPRRRELGLSEETTVEARLPPGRPR